MKALLSIHDVMPETLPQVAAILERIPSNCHRNLVMLVVPGRDWQPDQIDRLRDWQDRGYLFAGHGWNHEARRVKSLYHRLHSALLSRNAAEHLALSKPELIELLQRNADWFVQHDLEQPDYYVPPAWALGALDDETLRSSPFSYFETLGGIRHIPAKRAISLPLVGFEADTRWRQWSLGSWNQCNWLLATERRPLRVSIHPMDFELRLAAQLDRMLAKLDGTLHYAQLFRQGSHKPNLAETSSPRH